MCSALIGSIELYLGIQKSMDLEQEASRNFLLLSYDIYKTLSLVRENRHTSGKSYLDEKFNAYIKLTEQANLIKNKYLKDTLTPIPEEFVMKSVSSENSSDIGISLENFLQV